LTLNPFPYLSVNLVFTHLQVWTDEVLTKDFWVCASSNILRWESDEKWVSLCALGGKEICALQQPKNLLLNRRWWCVCVCACVWWEREIDEALSRQCVCVCVCVKECNMKMSDILSSSKVKRLLILTSLLLNKSLGKILRAKKPQKENSSLCWCLTSNW